jgi:UDP-galactopyranose mutase
MPDLIVFSHLRWNFVYQRPQHLLSRLARQFRILFVEEPVLDAGPARFEHNQVLPNLSVLRPLTPVEAPGFHDDQLSVLKPMLRDHFRAHPVDEPLVWFYTPMALPLLTQLRPRGVIFDCMDELSAFKDAPRQLRQREAALLKSAHLVLTGGPSLYEAKRHANPRVVCLPSAVDAAHFSRQRALADEAAVEAAEKLQGGIAKPRLGFAGVIDERIDLGLIDKIAAANASWQIIMVGPVAKIDPASLPQRANIHWLGQQPYMLLPQLIAGWDACLLPFALNESTRFISPTKTLEYMAAEKSAVSTQIHDVRTLYGEVVRIAEDHDEFIAQCQLTLDESGAAREERQRRMAATVERYSWDNAAAQVCEAIDEMLRTSRPLTISLGEAQTTSSAAAGSAATASAAVAAAPLKTGLQGGTAALATPRRVRHVVIGAGPTGLSAAYHLGGASQQPDVLLVEREPEVGGWCRSVYDQGFTFDYAGHIMFSNDPYVLEMYKLLLGDNVHWQNREAWVYSKNVYTRYPFQGSLYGLPPKVLKECLVGAIEARFGPLKGKAGESGQNGAVLAQGEPKNFEEFIYRVWGAGVAKHFAVPYNEKLWAVPLNEMETSWLGGRVPLPDLEQMIEGALEPTPAPMGPNARFGYPLRGGFQALMDAFRPHLKGELALNTSVVHVSPSKRTLRLDDGRTVQYDKLISTMALPQLIAACGSEAPPEVQAAARALRHVSVRCVNLGVGRRDLTEKHWIYYPEDTVFHRIFVQGNASPYCSPPEGCGLICEITYGPSKPLPCDGQALIDRVIDDCRRVGMLRDDDRLITANQVDLPCAYVVYDHMRAQNVERVRAWLASFGIILAGRYSEWEYYNSDHAFLAGKKAAEQAIAALAAAANERPVAAAQGKRL